MLKEIYKIIPVILLSTLAVTINYYYGSIGVLPINTFSYFDPAFRVINGEVPFVDYWTISGPFIDLLQAFYFSLFGVNWTSYILNGSIINLIVTLVSFYFFRKLGLNRNYSFFYAACIAILANPSMGPPFPDHYSSFFSLLAIISFIYALETKKKIYWFLIPILFFIAFFCKQTPSAYVNLIFILNFIIYLLIKKDFNFLKPVLYGVLISLSFFCLFIWFNKIELNNFITQYFLFPKTIGLYRATEWNFTFNKLISNLKLIYIVLIPLIYIFFKKIILENNYINKNEFFYNLSIISYAISLIIHQLLTLNFIFIFFLIPLICAILQINLKKNNYKKVIPVILLSFCLIATIKYHIRFNEHRKMHILEDMNLEKFYDSSALSPKLKGLKWISRNNILNNGAEIKKIYKIKNVLDKEKKKIMFLSNYNFFSVILDKPLNSPNRWYGSNVSHPAESNLYYDDYVQFNYKLILRKKIDKIYIDTDLGDYYTNISNKILNFFPKDCSKKEEIEKVLVVYDISNCHN